MTQDRTFEDAFNLLCGKLLGHGIHRKVFECRIRPDLVVKVEDNGDSDWRYFDNVHEMKFWNDNQYRAAVAKWLAPCEFMSPDGRILLQKRTRVATTGDTMPDRLPAFLTDVKHENFGWIDGQLVCHDYAMTIDNVSTRLRKVEWS